MKIRCYTLAAAGAIFGQSLFGAPVVGPFNWTEEAQMIGSQSDYKIVSSDNGDASHLRLKTGSVTPSVYTLRTLSSSIVGTITAKHYAILGHIEYHNVAPGSFLELENWFAPEQPGGAETFYYSRTLAEAGPLAKIEGSDDGRDFALPFDATGAKTPLVRLVLKLHLNGQGELELSNVRLVQDPPEASAFAHKEEVLQVTQSVGSPLQGTFDGKAGDWNVIEDLLKQRSQADPQMRLVLQGSDSLPYPESTTRIIQALKLVGVQQVRYEPIPDSSAVPATPSGTKIFGPPVRENDYEMGWNDGSFVHPPLKMDAQAQGIQMSAVYWGDKPVNLKLQEIGPDFLSNLSSGRYAVIGKYWGVKIAAGSYLEMLSRFTPAAGGAGRVYFSQMPITGDAEATPDDPTLRNVLLPFEGPPPAMRLDRVTVNLHLAGGYGSRFSVLRMALHEFGINHPFPIPAGFVVPTTTSDFLATEAAEQTFVAPLTALPGHTGLDLKSFLGGVLASVAAALVFVGLFILGNRLRHFRHARELRRIASLDG